MTNLIAAKTLIESHSRFSSDEIEGFLHTPFEPQNRGLLLTHGAGGNCQTALLIAVADAFTAAGFHVLRFDLPFRMQRRFGPPHPSKAAEDRNGLLAAVACMRKLISGRVLLGGHSYGGRQASMLLAEKHSVADGLVLLSYPLHPPKKPDQLRTVHFAKLNTPSLFVHGTKDPFGTVDELRIAMQLIPAACELSIVENAGHDLSGGKFDVASLVVDPAEKLLGQRL